MCRPYNYKYRLKTIVTEILRDATVFVWPSSLTNVFAIASASSKPAHKIGLDSFLSK